jgi:pimeloyl-ACP methyl ester carboxylesterase
MHWLKKHWWVVIIGFVLAAAIGFVAWGLLIPEPMPEAMEAMQSDSQVIVTTDPWIVFQPTEQTPSTGLIIYPGGRVNPRAYAPLAQAIAAQGYLVVIVPMPLNLAVFGSNRAESIIATYPDIQNWIIGGHSLGGSMAALYADKHRDQIDGLALLASYPANSNSLSDSTIEVTSIFGTQDGLATGDKIDASRELLPADTVWVPIEGGNHAQFGWYGEQSGDNPATISRQEQQAQVIQATLDLLESTANKP